MRFARLLGLDLIRDRQGQWWLLEVNDVPSNLAQSDELTAGCPGSFGVGGCISRIAEVLSRSANSGLVMLLRPPSRIGTKNDEHQIDCQAIGEALKILGRECVIASPSSLDPCDGLRLNDGSKIGAVYRRTHVRPDCSPFDATINPASLVHICRDKQRTHDILSDLGILHVPTAVSTLKLNKKSTWYIRKPRFGAGSRNVERITEEMIDFRIGDSSSTHVLQPWIEPDVVRIGGNAYYFDVRIIVLDGVIVNSYARCAAAPAGGVTSGTQLEWLTTLGQNVPIVIGDASSGGDIVAITAGEADFLEKIAYSIAAHIDKETALIEPTIPPIGSPHSLLPILFISSNDEDSRASVDAVRSISAFEGPVAIADISNTPDEWLALKVETRWPTTPQLVVGREHFVGSRVIEEAVFAGEIERAINGEQLPRFKVQHTSIPLTILEQSDHEADVWCCSSVRHGTRWATGAADGTVKIVVEGQQLQRLKICDNWINSLSFDPGGSRLLIGTSGGEALLISMDGQTPELIRRFSGHCRWVNGVVAAESGAYFTVSSDGAIAHWSVDDLVKTSKFVTSGHVLGMRLCEESQCLLIWASDGVVERRALKTLECCMRWQVPTSGYVTCVCELTLDNERRIAGLDSNGRVYLSHQEKCEFDIRERAWGFSANDALGLIVIATVSGELICIRYNQPQRPVERRNLNAPAGITAAEFISETRALIVGFANGEVRTYDF